MVHQKRKEGKGVYSLHGAHPHWLTHLKEQALSLKTQQLLHLEASRVTCFTIAACHFHQKHLKGLVHMDMWSSARHEPNLPQLGHAEPGVLSASRWCFWLESFTITLPWLVFSAVIDQLMQSHNILSHLIVCFLVITVAHFWNTLCFSLAPPQLCNSFPFLIAKCWNDF